VRLEIPQCSRSPAPPRCAILTGEIAGETARVHHADWWGGDHVAARGACAGGGSSAEDRGADATGGRRFRWAGPAQTANAVTLDFRMLFLCLTSRGHQANWFHRLQRSPWTLAIVAVGAVLTGLAAWTQAIDTLLLFTGIKPNALQLARDDERARFSRELTRAAWNRLFAMRRYVSTVEAGYPALDQDRTWERYASIFEEWNRDLMVNILSLEQHYHGYGKREEFENVILPAFTTIHRCLEGLRRPTTTIECELSKARDINSINKALEQLNQNLYCFVFGLPDPKRQDPKARCFNG